MNYAYRNMDPFDGTGQFCDRGSSYRPAVFYATEEERLLAEDALETILLQRDWDAGDIAAPILPRPVFWTAETYHQDYYIKNPTNYGYYKNRCGRPQRLKQVWGEDEYRCYHEEAHTCFVTADTADWDPDDTGNSTSVTTGYYGDAGDDQPPRLEITNADGELVAAESNIKNAEPERRGRIPTWGTALVLVALLVIVLVFAIHMAVRKQRTTKTKETQRPKPGAEGEAGAETTGGAAQPTPTTGEKAAAAASPDAPPKTKEEAAV